MQRVRCPLYTRVATPPLALAPVTRFAKTTYREPYIAALGRGPLLAFVRVERTNTESPLETRKPFVEPTIEETRVRAEAGAETAFAER